jgi:hypothetical protein
MTPAQFDAILAELDRLQSETSETIQAARSLRLKVEKLPTLKDIYLKSFRLWAVTFGPTNGALLLMLLWAYLSR